MTPRDEAPARAASGEASSTATDLPPSWGRRSWALARERAAGTPASRNRYVDFLRAASITVVVIGHWLMAAPNLERGAFTLSDILLMAPWTQWLTWIFQVMPLFFVVGGYANATSWAAHHGAGEGYAAWVSRRLQRLVRPLVPLLVVWCLLAVTARWLGLSARIVGVGSRVAFIPMWFLAVYVLVVLAAPFTHRFWERHGMGSVWALVLAAAAVEALALGPGLGQVRWFNYAFVWLALHQLGHAWRHGGVGGASRSLLLAAIGLAALALLVGVAGYPVSMVTVPGDPVSNTNPPTLALLALGIAHCGLVLAADGPARRWLEGPRVWTTTALVNGAILTLYLWHATVMVLLVTLLEWPGGVGLDLIPDSPEWWLTRPLWVAALLALLVPVIAAFGRFEARPPAAAPPPGAWRSVTGAAAVCVGLVWLASEGIGAPNALGLNVLPVAVSLAGTALVAGRWSRGSSGSHVTTR